MVREALRGYLALAGGLTEVTTNRARAAARALVEQGEATASQVGALAEDLLATSRRNRESLAVLVSHEVDQAVRRLGLASAADVEALTRRVRDLEQQLRQPRAPSAPASGKTAKTAKKSPRKAAAKPSAESGVSGEEPAT
jgi:polyhydroxyalkanoate synthesis regulator phasin